MSDVKPNPRKSKDIFTALCDARAYLYMCGDYTLREYTDWLQAWATRHDLIKEIGQDEVQLIMARSLAPYRDDLGGYAP
jgi:hypothetical protein